ncbi:MAG: UDP-N-acetylmuramoyl-L-alanine--D-glutamate ligase [Actinomycetota bacterium]|nr:UDP-N-acetylmuramoyl-L-alanine--D-glutamate ligase [Actinomycetota bacterium]
MSAPRGDGFALDPLDGPALAPLDQARIVCVAGLGISGEAAARALLARGSRVVLVDARDGEAEQRAADRLRERGADVRLGTTASGSLPNGTGLVVTSPGWRPTAPLLQAAAAADVPIWGEPELAWRLRPSGAAPWLALTGTNGKTTTVRMLAAMLGAAGRRAIAAGNVGTPLVDAVLADSPADVLAVELSSFQLHWSPGLRPAAAAVLNIAPDHLDWHGSLQAYAATKARIWSGGTAIGNADDEPTAALLAGAPGPHISFTLAPPAAGQFGVADGWLVDATGPDGPVPLAPVDEVRPAGPHNVANALAAAALARAYGVAPEAVRTGLQRFVPDPHRNAPVLRSAGVTWVDDSKATNPHAAAASLSAYDSVIWIAGGLGKGLSFDELVAAAAGRLRAVVTIGHCRHEVAEAVRRHAAAIPVHDAGGADTGTMTAVMDAAVDAAARMAGPGDTVLLAPAAASMDMFTNYGERGDVFAATVQRLAGGRADQGGHLGSTGRASSAGHPGQSGQ